MSLQNQKILNYLKQSIADVHLIYLFGSAANNTSTNQSDIDIAFWTPQTISNLERWELQEKLAAQLKQDVDLVNMQTASDILLMQIITKGKLLYAINLRLFIH